MSMNISKVESAKMKNELKLKKELGKREWALYRYLKEKGDTWTCQWEIARELKEFYGDCRWFATSFHDSNARHLMTKDIQTINNSAVIQKIIITGSKGVKLANKDEFEKHIANEFASVFRRLQRVRIKAKKGGLDGQMKMVFGSERDTVEAFIEKAIKGEL